MNISDIEQRVDEYFKERPLDVRGIVRGINAVRDAEDEVALFVGPVLGMDSAAVFYVDGLKRLGRPTRGLREVPAPVLQQIFRHARRAPVKAAMASDAQIRNRTEMFPNANRLHR